MGAQRQFRSTCSFHSAICPVIFFFFSFGTSRTLGDDGGLPRATMRAFTFSCVVSCFLIWFSRTCRAQDQCKGRLGTARAVQDLGASLVSATSSVVALTATSFGDHAPTRIGYRRIAPPFAWMSPPTIVRTSTSYSRRQREAQTSNQFIYTLLHTISRQAVYPQCASSPKHTTSTC
ncbi:hypothetical protein B0T14DRAFT_148909 [Immersiella caudata]|uniref:Uncharacterized protein n=1 Tax=Immersiella caudata TaxID=314043 RepID=A0AA39WVL3_9PEZI|nr:hypothetical protein B0T14DRAFT_148909 [Immersiella caudata]